LGWIWVQWWESEEIVWIDQEINGTLEIVDRTTEYCQPIVVVVQSDVEIVIGWVIEDEWCIESESGSVESEYQRQREDNYGVGKVIKEECW